ncbi:M20/M25/M40 family metallo-hydrolase [Massilia sp. LjRoot122]|uniref:M20/M25/M40 family metallo-hydrolase n=1 Tax=Massilia sp. LjRoot122 TaxID=3342257 RepID=UPI003ED0D0F3
MSGPLMPGLLHASVLALALIFTTGHAAAQPDPLSASERLAAEIGARTPMMDDLEALCDEFGARLTGSDQLRAAQAWAMRKLAVYGATSVRLEAYPLGRSWRRGQARARLLNANRMALDVVQKAWTHGTRGVVRAPVGVLDVKSLDGLRQALPALKGRIVLVLSLPSPSAEQQKDPAGFRAEVDRSLAGAGLAGVLLVSSKASGLHDMWGGPDSRFDRNAGIVTREGANLLRRLLARGVIPQLELELGGGFDTRQVEAHNVVADFAGNDAADEMVIVGAHIDSWDLACGATDNGSGTVVAMEVLRALHATGLRPRRTLRVVLFSGEEQGLLGSKAYVAAHRDELPKVQAVLVQDAGAGRITGFPDMKVEAWFAALSAAVGTAKQLSPLDIMYAVSRGSDHASFFDAGVPAFAAIQDGPEYRSHTQHTQADAFEQVRKADLLQAAQVMTVTAWELLNGPRLPHLPPAPARVKP